MRGRHGRLQDWEWYPEYDLHYGKPLAPAVHSAEGWRREFEGCTVTVTDDLLNATIVFKHDHATGR